MLECSHYLRCIRRAQQFYISRYESVVLYMCTVSLSGIHFNRSFVLIISCNHILYFCHISIIFECFWQFLYLEVWKKREVWVLNKQIVCVVKYSWIHFDGKLFLISIITSHRHKRKRIVNNKWVPKNGFLVDFSEKHTPQLLLRKNLLNMLWWPFVESQNIFYEYLFILLCFSIFKCVLILTLIYSCQTIFDMALTSFSSFKSKFIKIPNLYLFISVINISMRTLRTKK